MPSNWTGLAVPGIADTACIAGAATVDAGGSPQPVGSVSVVGGSTLNVTSGTFMVGSIVSTASSISIASGATITGFTTATLDNFSSVAVFGTFSGATINGNRTFTGGTVSGLYPLVRGMYDKRKDKIEAIGWNNEFNVGQARIVADLSWSKAKRNELQLENNTQLYPAPQLDTLTLHFNPTDFSTLTPGRDYSDPTKLFLSNTTFGVLP